MWYVVKEDELYHHGVKGQKWGVRHGPPYPLKSGTVKQPKAVPNKRSVDEKTSKLLYEYDGNNPKQQARTISKNISDDTKKDLRNMLAGIKKHYKKWESSDDDDNTGYSKAREASAKQETAYRERLEQEAKQLLGRYADMPAPKRFRPGGKSTKGLKAYQDLAQQLDDLVTLGELV